MAFKSFKLIEMSKNLKKVNKYLKQMLPVSYSNIEYKTLILLVAPDDVFFVLRFLKFHNNTQYSVLSLISCTDYLFRKRRFEVIYDLLSIRFNSRIRIKTFVDEIIPLKSVVGIFPSASWWEREVWDMFGVFFLVILNFAVF